MKAFPMSNTDINDLEERVKKLEENLHALSVGLEVYMNPEKARELLG